MIESAFRKLAEQVIVNAAPLDCATFKLLIKVANGAPSVCPVIKFT